MSSMPEAKSSSRRITLRYALFFIHFLLLVVIIITSITSTVKARKVLLVIHCCSAVPFAVYIIPATILGICGRRTQYDTGAGEVSYLSIACAFWLGSLIFEAVILDSDYCIEVWRPGFRGSQTHQMCDTALAITILSGVHFFVLLFWMIWIIRTVQNAKVPRAQGFRIPLNDLLGGDDLVARVDLGNAQDEWEERGLRASTREHIEPRSSQPVNPLASAVVLDEIFVRPRAEGDEVPPAYHEIANDPRIRVCTPPSLCRAENT